MAQHKSCQNGGYGACTDRSQCLSAGPGRAGREWTQPGVFIACVAAVLLPSASFRTSRGSKWHHPHWIYACVSISR